MAGWLDIGLINIQHIIYTPLKDLDLWDAHSSFSPWFVFVGNKGLDWSVVNVFQA
jgi:hypothetical protein